MYERGIAPRLLEALEEEPVVFLRGPRQAGKTTLVRSLEGDRHYRTFDDLGVLSAARHDPHAFVAGLPEKVVIDEIQRCPELLLAIKMEVDQRRLAGRFLLTGSSDVRVSGAVSESLAGRMRTLDLLPLSQAEMAADRSPILEELWNGDLVKRASCGIERGELLDKILRGGFPEAVARSSIAAAQRWLRAYTDALIERDMTDLARIADVSQVSRLLSLSASRTSTVTNYSDFARVLGAPNTTLRRYLALAEAVFLTVEIPAWAGDVSSRLVRQPKLHLVDTGVACSLMGVDGKFLGAQGVLLGQIFETFVVGEIRKAVALTGGDYKLSHYRSHTGREVDLVIEARDGSLCAIEVKLGGTMRAEDFSGLRHFREITGSRFRHGYVIHGGDSRVSFDSDLHAVPVSALWGA